jgi:hypothetical protein
MIYHRIPGRAVGRRPPGAGPGSHDHRVTESPSSRRVTPELPAAHWHGGPGAGPRERPGPGPARRAGPGLRSESRPATRLRWTPAVRVRAAGCQWRVTPVTAAVAAGQAAANAVTVACPGTGWQCQECTASTSSLAVARAAPSPLKMIQMRPPGAHWHHHDDPGESTPSPGRCQELPSESVTEQA